MRLRSVHQRLTDQRDQALMRSLGTGMSTVSDRAPRHSFKDHNDHGLAVWMRRGGSLLGTGLIWLGQRLGGSEESWKRARQETSISSHG